MGRIIVAAQAEGPVLAAAEGVSFWGGIDPATGRVIDAHHPLHGETVAGKVVVMPTSRGSCSGSGVLLELALNGHAPAALVFREAEDILTLGALVAGRMFGRPLPVLRLRAEEHDRLATAPWARISPTALEAGDWHLPLVPSEAEPLDLTAADRSMLAGADGPAAQLAMDILCAMARAQGARTLCDVTRAHIDGCIYASPANLTFAETMARMGARVRIPTTMNAISVDHDNWRGQGVPPAFGRPASHLADAYVAMGAQPSFTCAPYHLETPEPPGLGEAIGWSESNAVIYANSVLGARTVKHPDFLDLCIAVTGRAPHTGAYMAENRRAHSVIEVEVPGGHDDAFWPLLGWLAGRAAPAAIPLLRGLSATAPDAEALKALCAAFGTTSAAPMLHIQGVTPEAHLPVAAGAETTRITRHHMAELWRQFNAGPAAVDLVAIGSPHASVAECDAVARAFAGRRCASGVTAIITLGRETLRRIRDTGVLAQLEGAGVRVLPDLCWCSISEPVFPSTARVLMTNSGKYAHYAPGLSGRAVRFGGIAACVETAVTGRAPEGLPPWLESA